MFLDFYKLREQPFGVTPNPRYLYFSPGHREALASLFYGIETGRGFLALIAQPGMGKTTLLFQLLERLKDSVRTAFLFQTQCNSRELLRYVLEALGLNSQGDDVVQMHAQLNEFLFREALAGRRVVLVIDEAQNLSNSALETVRLLSDFEASDRKLLQIVLAGQPELAHRLAQPGLSQLRQRIAVLKGLAALPPAEADRYIRHRLQVAGYEGPELFTLAATTLIAERSQGIPRNINNICFNALSLGCAMGRKSIGPEVVEEATADLALDPLVWQPRAVPRVIPTPPSRTPSLFSRIREKLPAARFAQIVALLAVFGSVMVFSGEHSKAGSTVLSHAIHQIIPSVGGTSRSQAPAAPLAPDRLLEVSRPTPVQTESSKDSSAVFTYVVQPHDTLRDLCMWFMGGYDDGVLAEIRNINQDLTDPNHIVAGQQIRFPLYPNVAGNFSGNGEHFRKRGK